MYLFTESEVREVIDALLFKGPRLIPTESIEAMRDVLLEHAEPDEDATQEKGNG